MKKWIITGLVVAALAVAGAYVHWWLPKLLPFLEKNSSLIQTIGPAIQIVLWTGAGLAFVIRLWLAREKQETEPGGGNVSQTAQGGGINVAGPASAEGDIVGRDKVTNIYQSPAAAPTPTSSLHQLPPPPRDFTGREREIRELMEALGNGGATISGLQGMGGVGKTALALKLAEQLALRYSDAQFYLDLKGVSQEPLAPKAAMEHVIRAYHPDAKLPEDETELSGLYRSVLHDQKALLLMDNARDARQVEPLIPPASCMLLVTSRQQFTLPGLVTKNLDALSPSDARALLIRIAPRLAQEKKDYTSDLARLCGYLPLALRSVASALAARINVRPGDYVQKLADTQERLKLTAIDASLQLSYDLLIANLQKRLRGLAVFPDSFEVEGAAAVWEVESNVAEEALGELLVYSLLEFNPAGARYRLHDLVRVFADAQLKRAERGAAEKRHAEHYKNVLAAADDFYLKGGESVTQGLALFDLEWSNIQGGQAWAAKRAGEDKAAAELCIQYPDAGVYCLGLRLHPREHIRWLETALAASRTLKSRALESAHLGNLGIVYFSVGDYRRAIDYHEKALVIHREIGDRRGEGIALGNLGNAYDSLAEYPRAIDYHEQRLNIAREFGDRRGEGNALGGLGNAYYSQSEYRRAIEYYEQSLEIARGIGDRRGEGQALGGLGNAYNSLGDYRRAIGYYEEDLNVARGIGDRRGEGIGLWNMSLTLDQLGERAKAIAHAEAALEVYEQIEHPSVEKVRKKLANWRGNA